MGLNASLLYSRFAKYFRDAEGVDYRMLIKAYGIRFDVMVNGKVRAQATMPQSLEGEKVEGGSSEVRTASLACCRKGLFPSIHVELTPCKRDHLECG